MYDPRHLDKIYIANDNGMDYETCILLEPSQQYKSDFLEEVVFQHQLRKQHIFVCCFIYDEI
ncbi:hypothetical protein LS41612_01480 [Lysinibacillus sphaericus]|uniref:Uncharacterized protein n=1 Tax=Lysinibacillus sphaericus TaxID=1421 RepID=A0A2S0JVD1_LYSSH|nr:hypothetical protein LS41612_01480 [Lysinibacillus sphaericus]